MKESTALSLKRDVLEIKGNLSKNHRSRCFGFMFDRKGVASITLMYPSYLTKTECEKRCLGKFAFNAAGHQDLVIDSGKMINITYFYYND